MSTLVRPPLAILILATAIGPLTMNIFLTVMPDAARLFDTTPEMVKLTVTLFLVGVGCGQLVYGPLSDRFGRRPVLLWGIGLFVLASAGCALAETIDQLVIGRVLQGLSGCAGMVIARAVVRDIHDREGSAKALAYIGMAMVVAPMISPGSGALLYQHFGWHAPFLFVLGGGAVVWLGSWLWLVETNHQRVPMPGLAGFARANLDLLARPVFLGYALQTGFALSIFFGFITAAPYLVADALKLPASAYGLWFVLLSLGFMLGNFATTRIGARLGVDGMVTLGSLVTLVGVGGTLAFALAGIHQPWALFGPMFFFSFGNGLAMPNALAGAVSVVPRLAGTAAGLSGALQMFMGAATSVVVGRLPTDSTVPLTLLITLLAVLAIVAHQVALAAQRWQERRAAAALAAAE